MLKAQDLLVPVDFSPCSVNALRVALGMAAPDGDVTLLHVIDQHFIEDCVAAGMGTTEAITAQLRTRADASFDEMLTGLDADGVDIERMVVVGVPFVGVLKIARDLDLPTIVMGGGGVGGGRGWAWVGGWSRGGPPPPCRGGGGGGAGGGRSTPPEELLFGST